jgi:hypothetical protein
LAEILRLAVGDERADPARAGAGQQQRWLTTTERGFRRDRAPPGSPQPRPTEPDTACGMPLESLAMHRHKRSIRRMSARRSEEEAKEEREAAALDVILNDQLKVSSEAELKRADSSRQRASWLLGFAGVILGLGAAQADELLKASRELGAFGHIFASVALGLAFVAVAFAAGWSLQALSLTKRIPEFSACEIREALDDKFVSKGKSYNQFRIAEVLQKQVLARREVNHRSNRVLRRAFGALLIAVVLFTAQTGVFVENSIEGHVCPYEAELVPVALSRGPHVAFANLEPFMTHSLQIALERPPCPPRTEPVPE